MSERKLNATGNAEKWQAPAMTAEPGHVLRYRQENKKSAIPTADEVEQWRKMAEEEGYQDGINKAQQEVAELQKRLIEIIEFFEHPLKSLNEDIENQLTQLAVTLAQQLVRRELKVEPGEIIGLIRESVQLLPGNSRNITITLHPDDAQLVRSALSIESDDEEHSWKLIEDPMISVGGCEIKAPPSAISATLENRLSALAASVLGSERERD